jgi:hypothetical protein
MHRTTVWALLLSAAALAGCSRTVLVPVPPRVDLNAFGTLGVVEIASNAGPAVDARATRDFQARLHAAQPGTRLLEIGSRAAVLAAVGARQFDAEALRKIGERYGVGAVFLGEITYSDPKTSVKITDITRLEGGARTVIRGDMSGKLLETRSGASVWSSTAWATRQLGRVSVSADRGVSGTVQSADPREEMVSTLLLHLTGDFRPGTARQRAD